MCLNLCRNVILAQPEAIASSLPQTFACQAEAVFKGSDLRGNLDQAYSKQDLAQLNNVPKFV